MKKNMIIIGVTGFVLLGGAFGVSAFSEPNQGKDVISVDKAEGIALNEVDGSIESVELDHDDGRLEYEVEIESQNSDDDTDVDIDAVSGEVIKVDSDQSFETVSAEKVKSQRDDDDNKAATVTKEAEQVKQISKEEAIAIAVKDSAGKVVDVEYDEGEYEIEVRTATHEIEYEINAKTGKIVEKDMDNLDDEDDDNRDDD